MGKYNRPKAIKDYPKLSKEDKNKWEEEFNEHIEKFLNKQELVEHIYKSSLFNKILKKEFDSFLKKYCNVVKYPEILSERENNLWFIFKGLLFKRVKTSSDFLNELQQFYRVNGKKFNKALLGRTVEVFKPVIKEIFLVPNLFVAVLQLNDSNWEEKYKGIKTSDPDEQKLFVEVWKINKEQLEKNIKFSPYATFNNINDNYHYINESEIQQTKFTVSPLYNRYKQYRLRQQKSKRKRI